MRTTLNIDDALYRDLKAQAARSGTSVTALVEDAVRVALARTQQVSGPGAARDLRLTTVAGRGLRPGVDLSDGAAAARLHGRVGRGRTRQPGAMRLPDVNVLVAAHREDAPGHDRANRWIRAALAAPEPLALCAPVLAGMVRVVTHPRVFDPPSSVEQAWAFVGDLRGHDGAVEVRAGPRHLDLLERLCRDAHARGNLVPDAVIAAIAVEHGCEVVTDDGDFARFEHLRWSRPG